MFLNFLTPSALHSITVVFLEMMQGGGKQYMYCAKLIVRSAFNMMQYSVEKLGRLGLVGEATLSFNILEMEKIFLLYRNLCVTYPTCLSIDRAVQSSHWLLKKSRRTSRHELDGLCHQYSGAT